MLRHASCVLALLMLASCQHASIPADDSKPTVNSEVAPRQSTVVGAQGKPQAVASSRDSAGVQSDFILGVVRVRGVNQDQLNAFLSRYGGTVIANDALPDPPVGSGVKFTAEQRQPTEHVVRIDLSKVDTSSFAANAAAIGLTGAMEFSSHEALETIAAVVDAVAAGYRASADYLLYPRQFPAVLLKTEEGPTAANLPLDAFSSDSLGFGTRKVDGFSNVTLAWQFIGAHGITRRTKLAIVDGGFWLDAEGKARITDTDFPFGVKIPQYDFVNNDEFADGPGTVGCNADAQACWHGTMVAGVAAGLFNNKGGEVGPGGLVADMMLLSTSTKSTTRAAIRYAVAMGADVVNMSYGARCNKACRISDREDNPFNDAFDAGSKTVFVAAAPNEPYDVGDPNFDHPCIQEHVICVGALNLGSFDDQLGKASYSGFGDEVDLFAPSDVLRVMSMPVGDNSDPASQYYEEIGAGCSAACAFVSGVAAMVKAINPDLNSEQVEVLLRETAHGGEVRYLDAYAAVRRAADGIPAVKDPHESGLSGNDLDTTPTDLTRPEFGGIKTFYNLPNLNLHRAEDRDFFKFEAPANSTAIIDLEFPTALGSLSVVNAEAAGNCTPPVLTGQETPKENLRRFTYRLGGGTYQFAVAGTDINAYDLSFVLAASPVDPDIYESPPPNNNIRQDARLIQTLQSTGGGLFKSFRIDPTVTITASLHDEDDEDWYIVRGARPSLSDIVYLNGSPAVKVYGNDASITLQVIEQKPVDDGKPDKVIGEVNGTSCTAEPLIVSPLTKDVYYLVKVTGSPGRYLLHNGIAGEKRRLPILVRDRAYEVLHPLDPITKPLQQPEFFVFVADPAAYPNIIAAGPPLHARLFDLDGNLIGEGQAQGAGERINLAGTAKNGVYALQVSPLKVTAGQPDLSIGFEPAPPARDSGNLVINGDAETLVAPDPEQIIPYWSSTGAPETRLYGEAGFPSTSDPGPAERGARLLAGGGNALSTLRQIVNFDPSWFAAIDAGRVRFRLAAFLGGFGQEADTAKMRLIFRRGDDSITGSAELPAITALDRQGQTGLFQAQISDLVPAGTAQVFVDVIFEQTNGVYNDGYADNIEFSISEAGN